jgi:hypothetical protein
VVIATQEPTLSTSLIDLCNVTIVHRFLSPAWFQTLKDHLAGARLADKNSAAVGDIFRTIVGLQTGEALMFSPTALLRIGPWDPTTPFTKRPLLTLKDSYVKVRIRKRITADGGRSIMATDARPDVPPEAEPEPRSDPQSDYEADNGNGDEDEDDTTDSPSYSASTPDVHDSPARRITRSTAALSAQTPLSQHSPHHQPKSNPNPKPAPPQPPEKKKKTAGWTEKQRTAFEYINTKLPPAERIRMEQVGKKERHGIVERARKLGAAWL